MVINIAKENTEKTKVYNITDTLKTQLINNTMADILEPIKNIEVLRENLAQTSCVAKDRDYRRVGRSIGQS